MWRGRRCWTPVAGPMRRRRGRPANRSALGCTCCRRCASGSSIPDWATPNRIGSMSTSILPTIARRITPTTSRRSPLTCSAPCSIAADRRGSCMSSKGCPPAGRGDPQTASRRAGRPIGCRADGAAPRRSPRAQPHATALGRSAVDPEPSRAQLERLAWRRASRGGPRAATEMRKALDVFAAVRQRDLEHPEITMPGTFGAPARP